jgi:hypothetical protein
MRSPNPCVLTTTESPLLRLAAPSPAPTREREGYAVAEAIMRSKRSRTSRDGLQAQPVAR